MVAGVELEKNASSLEMSNQESEKRRVVSTYTTMQLQCFALHNLYSGPFQTMVLDKLSQTCNSC